MSASAKRNKTFWITVALHLAVIIAIGVWLYYPSLDAPLKSFDDQRWLQDTKVRNSLVTMFDWRLQSRNPFATTYYLPLQSVLFYVLVDLFDHSARAFHIVSLLIHLLASALLYALLAQMTARSWIAFLGALLFVGHAGHTQSVTWVSAAFSHPWVTTFLIAALITWRRHLSHRDAASYALTFTAFVMATLVRETAVVLPPLLLAFELLAASPPATPRATSPSWRRRALTYLPFVLATIPIVAIALYKYPRGAIYKSWGGVSLGIHPLLRLVDFSTLLVYPSAQSRELKLALAAALLIVAALVLFRLKRRGAWVFCVLWMGATLAPYTISNFNATRHIMRYLYPASVGFVLLFALMLTAGLERRRGKLAGLAVQIPLCLIWTSYVGWHLMTTFKAIHK